MVWGGLILCVIYSESFLCAVLIMVHNGFRSEKVIKDMSRWLGLLVLPGLVLADSDSGQG